MPGFSDIKIRKSEIRAQAHRRRVEQPDRDVLSRRICERIAALPEFDRAGVVLLYVSYASEVGTSTLIEEAFARGKTVGVPYCVGEELGLFRLEDIRDLAPGAYDILEPRPALRRLAERRLEAEDLDLIVAPGVAFDACGRRLGHGKGYYDRLLARIRPETFLVAPAFECQIFDEIPTTCQDLPVDRVVTETNMYPLDEKK
jgi:5-formyltetrahydrofolate cyclo-ligase